MDRLQSSLLTNTEEYIQGSLTVGEFLDKIEARTGREATRRLRVLLERNLDSVMPD